jgi:hypothetical protein
VLTEMKIQFPYGLSFSDTNLHLRNVVSHRLLLQQDGPIALHKDRGSNRINRHPAAIPPARELLDQVVIRLARAPSPQLTPIGSGATIRTVGNCDRSILFGRKPITIVDRAL